MPLEAIEGLGERLKRCWRYYGQWTRTKSHQTPECGFHYLSGMLRLSSGRNIAHISRSGGVAEQNMQHYISHSPWSGRGMMAAIQESVAQRAELRGGMLILDESGEDKSGEHSPGVMRQYNGRHKQIENCQVGVYLTYGKGTTWTWVDGELYLPQRWFSAEYQSQRQKAEIPPERRFHSKLDLGWQMIERAQATGLDFSALAFDTFYGEDSAFRDRCRAAGIIYYADVRSSNQFFRSKPVVEFPPLRVGARRQHPRVTAPWSEKVTDIAQDEALQWEHLTLRADERGWLEADFAACPVWSVRADGQVVAETLLLRREKRKITFTLTNAPAATPLLELAQHQAQRYFIERTHQNAKSELGWDEFQALKYRAWEHHLAFTILASWFIAETQLDWQQEHPRDPALLSDYDTDVLPALSLANVREMLRAALPLPQLSSEQAALLVVQHLDNRTRSRKSRLKRRFKP
ncbi:MAG: IS701 family transposase [Candidatus Methanoperedens sp.]|nr:IS701 family transposase [Candidatus Methanoperedens sp.]